MKKCLVIGAAILDIIMQMDRLPRTGEDVYAKSQKMSVGGCAYNAADILEHFQAPHTLLAPVGTGMYADFIRQELKKAHHESPVKSGRMDNGYCLCMVEADGERTFLTLPGIECHFEKEWFEEIDPSEYDSVYISGYEVEGEGGEAIIGFIEKHPDLTVYYAPGPRIGYIDAERHERIFALSPVLHLNETEAADYTGEEDTASAALALYKKTGAAVIITLGEKGAYLMENGEGSLISGIPARVVDTIGAGDSHIGALMAMRQMGKSFEESVKTANRVSALVVGVQGATLTKEEFKNGGIL